MSQDKITIHGPKTDGSYIVEFSADGESLALVVPAADAGLLKKLQAKIPYGLAIPDPA